MSRWLQCSLLSRIRIGRRRGGGLPRAAWGFAALLLPSTGMRHEIDDSSFRTLRDRLGYQERKAGADALFEGQPLRCTPAKSGTAKVAK